MPLILLPYDGGPDGTLDGEVPVTITLGEGLDVNPFGDQRFTIHNEFGLETLPEGLVVDVFGDRRFTIDDEFGTVTLPEGLVVDAAGA